MKTIFNITLILLLIFPGIQAFGQKKAQSFTSFRVIQAPASKVWAVAGEDFGAIANSHPKIISSNYINGSLKSGEGAERVCNLNEKGTKFIKEKQVKYNPQGYTFEVLVSQMGGLPMDPSYSLAVYKVVPIDEHSCRFEFSISYRTKPRFLGGMMKGSFQKQIADYALAIEHHVLTGEVVNKENFKKIKKQYKG